MRKVKLSFFIFNFLFLNICSSSSPVNQQQDDGRFICVISIPGVNGPIFNCMTREEVMYARANNSYGRDAIVYGLACLLNSADGPHLRDLAFCRRDALWVHPAPAASYLDMPDGLIDETEESKRARAEKEISDWVDAIMVLSDPIFDMALR